MTEPHTDEQRIAEQSLTREQLADFGQHMMSMFEALGRVGEELTDQERKNYSVTNGYIRVWEKQQQRIAELEAEVERLRKANSNHLRSLVKIADDYERLAFPEDDPTVRRTREKILKDVRKIIELAR